MLSLLRPLRPATFFLITLGAALPLAAQQYAPRQAAQPQRQPTQQPTQQRAATAQAQPRRAPAAAPKSNRPYPVRQTGGTQPLPAAGGAAQQQQQAAPAPGGRAMPAPAGPKEPFTLTQAEQALLDGILKRWEQHSDRINTFTCTFGRWEIDQTFGPKDNHYVLSEAHGEIKFKSPDHGAYEINKQTDWDAEKSVYVARNEGLEHWVCDGKSIFEFNAKQRQLIERELAPELQGKAITDGPLPFVFGTKAEQLKRRYWMRDITPAAKVNQEIHLEAYPKYQRDAANFHHAIIILSQKDFLPSALRIVLPDGKNKQDYAFANQQVNNPLTVLTAAFMAPRLPFGWTKVVIPAGGQQVPPPGDAATQAQQPAQIQR